METITINPRTRGQYQAEWRYYHLVYLEGESSNNSILCEVALQRFNKLLQEVNFTGVFIEDLEFPDLTFILSLLKKRGIRIATKHRPVTG